MCILFLQAIPSGESKIQPELNFFDVTRDVNTIIHMMEEVIQENLIPLLLYVFIVFRCIFKCLILVFKSM